MSNLFTNTIFNLSGKVALVTGAAGLLGVEHSVALAEAGADVVMTDINLEKLEISAQRVFEITSISPTTILLDVSNQDKVSSARKELERQGKIVNILINNAAIDPKVRSDATVKESSRLENFDIDKWNIEVGVGLTGAILCASEFGPGMAAQGGGVILNIASDLAVMSPDQRLYRKEGLPNAEQPVKPVSYSVIKSGLIGLTRYLSTYWADSNVRCNALSPGGVYNGQSDEFVQKLTELIPIKRMASKDEYRGAVQFLCSDASAYMNGQNIVMDGGRSIL
jgi:NAD(P)-dependent dehydrogenase (short-subunit alcohol dehydrogenase family)